MARAIDASHFGEIMEQWKKDCLECDDQHGADVIADVILQLDDMPTLTQPNEPVIRGFDVIDTKTGEYPDLWDIALKEDWAKDLMYCDMEGFAIEEDGTLLLLDECGKFRYCPIGRFEVRRPTEGDEKSERM